MLFFSFFFFNEMSDSYMSPISISIYQFVSPLPSILLQISTEIRSTPAWNGWKLRLIDLFIIHPITTQAGVTSNIIWHPLPTATPIERSILLRPAIAEKMFLAYFSKKTCHFFRFCPKIRKICFLLFSKKNV